MPDCCFRTAILGALCLALGAGAAAADTYPSKPIMLVVGFPPGGSNDVVARIIAPKASEFLGTPIVIDNRPGANATIGTQHVAKAAPDGYTITLGSASPLAISPHTYPDIPYDTLKDLAGVTTVAMTPEVVAVTPSVKAKSLKELIDLAKTQDVNVASSGNGGLPHLAIELFKQLANGKVEHVPYKGAGPAANDVVGGHVQAIIVDLPALYGLIDQKQLTALAVTSEHRAPVLPNVPTSVEQGYPTLLAVNWFAIMAPAKTPEPIIAKLHEAFVKAANDPEVKTNFSKVGIEPMTHASPAEFEKFLSAEVKRWGVVAKESGARAD
jgi:tripartite-type tricarboxylate transporter receptor subunit TctC